MAGTTRLTSQPSTSCEEFLVFIFQYLKNPRFALSETNKHPRAVLAQCAHRIHAQPPYNQIVFEPLASNDHASKAEWVGVAGVLKHRGQIENGTKFTI